MAEEAGKPKRQIKLGWIAGGVVAGSFALAALKVDAFNNWHFGAKVSHESALVMLAAALGVAILPVITPLLTEPGTWLRKLLRYATVLCVLATGVCAWFAYQDGQTEELARRQGGANTYQSAKEDEATARAEAKKAREDAEAIKELGSVAVLEKMIADKTTDKVNMAAGLKQQNIRCDQSRRCRAVDAELTAINQRLADAKSKQESLDRAKLADDRVRSAQERAKSGPVHAGAMENIHALNVMNALQIGITLLFGLFGELAAHCFKRCVVTAPAPKVKREPVVKPVVKQKADPAPSEQKRYDIAAFIRDCLEPAGEDDTPATPTELHDNLSAYWGVYNSGRSVPNKVMLGRALGKNGANVPKRKVKGGQRYAVKVRDWKSEAKRAIAVKAA